MRFQKLRLLVTWRTRCRKGTFLLSVHRSLWLWDITFPCNYLSISGGTIIFTKWTKMKGLDFWISLGWNSMCVTANCFLPLSLWIHQMLFRLHSVTWLSFYMRSMMPTSCQLENWGLNVNIISITSHRSKCLKDDRKKKLINPDISELHKVFEIRPNIPNIAAQKGLVLLHRIQQKLRHWKMVLLFP